MSFWDKYFSQLDKTQMANEMLALRTTSTFGTNDIHDNSLVDQHLSTQKSLIRFMYRPFLINSDAWFDIA